MNETKIITRCPSCHNQTLFLNEQGHIICSWIKCERPCMIHSLGEGYLDLPPIISPDILSQIPEQSVKLEDDFVVCPNCAYRLEFPYIGSTVVLPISCPACGKTIRNCFFNYSLMPNQQS